MRTASLMMAPSHSLVSLTLSAQKDAETVTVTPPTHHIFAIDCSGSMYSELPKIREQLKNKLATLVRELDVITVIWFSGRGECGFIVKGQEIKTLPGLKALQDMLDRYLRTVGLTGFLEPLVKVGDAIKDIQTSTKIDTHSLLFLTDGYDNQSSKAELVKAAKALAPTLASAAFVEYGFYANRALLLELAELTGGRTIFAERFQDYEPSFEQYVSNKLSGKPKLVVTLPSEPKYGVAYSYDIENGVVAYAVENGAVLVDAEVTQVFYHSELPVDTTVTDVNKLLDGGFDIADIYASIIVLSQRMKSQDVYDTLGFLGDVALVDSFVNAYGKQNLYAFQNQAQEILLGQRQPYAKGYKASYLPADDAYSLLNLFEDLMDSTENRFQSESEEFLSNYLRIGAKKVAAVSKEEARLQDELTAVTQEYMILAEQVKTDPSKRKLLTEVNGRMGALNEQIEDASEASDVKFVVVPNAYGTPIQDLVWNESRPNLSIRTRQKGTVKLPANKFGLDVVETYRYRNYTLIRDGIVNVKTLPVYLSEATFTKLQAETKLLHDSLGNPLPYNSDMLYYLDLTTLPIVNRKMVSEVSAKVLGELQYELTQSQGAQSVYNGFQKEHFPKKSEAFGDQYSAEAAEWLKELGITDYNGFNPRVTSEKMGETYMATELTVKIDGIASKPTFKTVWDKIKAGKSLTDRERLFEPAMLEYKAFVESAIYTKNENQDDLLKTWLLNKQKSVVTKVREYLNQSARIKFAVILGQTWFKEFKDLEDNQLVLTLDGKPVTITFKLEDKVIEI